MSDQWYAACLTEVQAFIDSLADADKRVVRYDSDLVAALLGLMQGAAIQMQVMRHLANAGQAASELG